MTLRGEGESKYQKKQGRKTTNRFENKSFFIFNLETCDIKKTIIEKK
jgi:hypothetical protein